MKSDQLHCEHAGHCAGCPLIHLPYGTQKEQKLSLLRALLVREGLSAGKIPPAQWVSLGLGGLRDRTDLTWFVEDGVGHLGLYDLGKEHIIDIHSCPQMSAPLASLFAEVREISFPVNLGSLRLRVGPQGQKGIWLDFSNERVKHLLDEKNCLRSLMKVAHVEIGQRRKSLTDLQGQLKLGDPEARPWFQTYLGGDATPTDLYCSIADFTQPSMAANRHLVDQVLAPLRSERIETAVEFGSGAGNFTLPLAFELARVDAFELEKRACENLLLNLKRNNLESKVEIHQGNFHKDNSLEKFSWGQVDFVLVDPPRTGLQGFLTSLARAPKKPKRFVYVSCFAESFAKDVSTLDQLGYRLESLSVLDQFPQSHHFEIVAHLVQA